MEPTRQQQAELTELQRLDRYKQHRPPAIQRLGPALLEFHDQSVARRQPRIEKLAAAWMECIPEEICRHCCLESFTRGMLTVLVDSAAHLYELKQLMLGGLQQHLLTTCQSIGLRKIAMRPGRWYAGDDAGAVRF